MVRGHRQISPELESVTDLMYALIRLVAERSGVATSVIASRDDLADYIEHPEQSPCVKAGVLSLLVRAWTICSRAIWG